MKMFFLQILHEEPMMGLDIGGRFSLFDSTLQAREGMVLQQLDLPDFKTTPPLSCRVLWSDYLFRIAIRFFA